MRISRPQDAVSNPSRTFAQPASLLLLTLLCALAWGAVTPLARGEAEAKPKAPSAPPAPKSDWLMEEFDWGDKPEIVKESIDYTPGYLCYKARGECKTVQVQVDGEKLLARFQFFEEELWRVAFITPPLDVEQAVAHGPRVLKTLAEHVRRHRGAPSHSSALPDVAKIGEGTHVVHHWKTETSVIEVILARRGARYFVAAYFADPARGARALSTAEDPTAPPRRPDGTLPVTPR